MKLGIELVGDWSRALRALDHIEGKGAAAIQQGLHAVAEWTLREVQTKALRKLKPLKSGTLLKRKLEGVGGKLPMFSSGDLFDSFEMSKVGDSWFVGVDAARIHQPSLMNLVKVIQMHEKGFTQVLVPTQKMMAKIKQIYGDKAKPKRGKERGVTQLIVVRVPPRPIFSELQKMMLAETEQLRDKFLKKVKKSLEDSGVPKGIITILVS